ncbi:formate dehydrogenase accessory sulfurtransferase FdhD [Achromobacter arsenitoxydans]|uniref:Sulfur carrier protein FdhD n=1 Tax=Achromobacter arsenitoxydans SY8 TaxID=477184 RepID=H0FDX6_9BURK|nr:formate dehydrogenase accessory sulfurtransferase FdhD [Achromobacter arsenitoxydans]EHK63498.1 formate dehydrogenase accessory protein [Achromobacter arsenitoxydans SY8]
MPTPTSPRPDCTPTQVIRVRSGAIAPAADSDYVAEETPVALEFNGISHATMLATPADLEDFAVGFALSEGIIGGIGDVRGIEVLPQCDGIVVQIEISAACEMRLKTRRRAMAGRTGCGLCGVETLPEVLRPVAPVANGAPVRIPSVLAAMRAMRERQTLHDITGATHAAGWADADGAVMLVREDVGRHNALDKLAGALTRQAVNAGDGIIVVSSRASFEMVQKTAAAGVPVLAAVSAPTALAIRLAADANVTLLGFLRDGDAALYTHPERIIT